MGYMGLFQFGFLGFMPRSGIAGSYGGFIPSLLRNLYTIFRGGCINLHSHQQCKSVPFSPAFIVCRLFDDGHSDWCIVVLICISLIMSNVEHLFMCLLVICMSSLEKCLFPTIWLGCLFFWHWVVWTACIFWKLILCQLFHCYYVLPFWGLSFHLAYTFACCTKAFKFNQVPLV